MMGDHSAKKRTEETPANQARIHTCTLCKKMVTSEKELTKHIENVHRNGEPLESEKSKSTTVLDLDDLVVVTEPKLMLKVDMVVFIKRKSILFPGKVVKFGKYEVEVELFKTKTVLKKKRKQIAKEIRDFSKDPVIMNGKDATFKEAFKEAVKVFTRHEDLELETRALTEVFNVPHSSLCCKI
jgi:hypothetical protein